MLWPTLLCFKFAPNVGSELCQHSYPELTYNGRRPFAGERWERCWVEIEESARRRAEAETLSIASNKTFDKTLSTSVHRSLKHRAVQRGLEEVEKKRSGTFSQLAEHLSLRLSCSKTRRVGRKSCCCRLLCRRFLAVAGVWARGQGVL